MKTDRLIDDVLRLIGENPDDCIHQTGGSGLSLRERISAEIEECARRAVADTPRMELTGWRLLDDDGLEIDSEGKGVLPLPSDFLMLFCIRMTSWRRPVSEILAHDSWLRQLQDKRWHGLRGTPQRPLVFTGPPAADGSRTIELFSCARPDTVAEGWYMPAPLIKDGDIEIPPAAYHRCLRYIVETFRM